MNILYIAAYTGSSKNKKGSPGGARKISLTVQMLCELGHNVTLLNTSSHSDSESFIQFEKKQKIKMGNHLIEMIFPFKLGEGKLNKLSQALFVKRIVSRVVKNKKIDAVLIYNTYLFEMYAAKYLKKAYQIPYIVQIEDLPWSRKRGLYDIKSQIEKKGFTETCTNASLLICVSTMVIDVVKKFNKNAILFPPIIDKKITSKEFIRKAPFSDTEIHIGIFGGLNKEKGADKAIELLNRLSSNYQIHVAGIGPLSDRFEEINKEGHSNFSYYGYISDDEYISLLSKMDILINPHVELSTLSNGVFPFKLFEYIGSGACVISNKLPEQYINLLDGICVYDGSTDDLIKKIELSSEMYDEGKNNILRKNVIELSGYDAVLERIDGPIGEVGL